MSLSTARTALRTAYGVARLPLQLVPDALARVQPVASEPRATATALLGGADQLVGLVLQDGELLEQGARLRDSARGTSGAKPAPVPWGIPPEPTTRQAADGGDKSSQPKSAPEPEPAEPEPADVDLTTAVESAAARAAAAAALREVDLEPATPGDEHHLIGHHVAVAPGASSPGEDKAAFAAKQREKADAEIAADDAARERRHHQAP